MENVHTSTILLDHSVGTHLAAFAWKHHLQNLQQLLALPINELWKMDGYDLHIQNEILDLAKQHGVVDALKQY